MKVLRPWVVLSMLAWSSCSQSHDQDAGDDLDGPTALGAALVPVDPYFEFTPPSTTVAPGGEPVTWLVIFDKSGSMDEPWSLEPADPTDPDPTDPEPAYAARTRWIAAASTLLDVIYPHRERVTVGALLFPQRFECGVPPLEDDTQLAFRSGAAFIDDWIARAPENGPSGSTPLESALAAADDALRAGMADGALTGRIEVIVLTDGEPTCADDRDAMVRRVEGWSELGIRTTVMGLPGSDAAVQILDRLAAAGGTGTHQPIGSPSELEDALNLLI